ncbi:MAG TPA: carboxypeptidase-like regulatory domain-containing protein [Candidatus Acidoferrales bacterium]|nr:carboxypeptidase-like regulatory domain-containing protein [Candidatus Acidoferrales bacterium]
MKKHSNRLLIALILILPMLCVGADKKKEDKKQADKRMATVTVTVLKDATGKPIRNASVILRPLEAKMGSANLKTDLEGKAVMEYVPFGTLRVQVIAQGMQTYGEDLEVKQEQQEFTIRLKPPAEQYSIYK